MVILTCQESKEVLDHVLFGILRYDKNDTDHPVVSAFCEAQIYDINEFDSIDEQSLEALTYKAKDPTDNTRYVC